MRTFVDAAERTWEVNVGFASLKRVKDRLGMDLLREDDLRRACRGLMEVADLLYVVCEPQCEAEQVTDEQFGELLIDCFQPASDALFEELADFFARMGRKSLAALIQKLVEWHKREEAERDAVLAKLIGSGKVDEVFATVSANAETAFNAKLDSLLKQAATGEQTD